MNKVDFTHSKYIELLDAIRDGGLKINTVRDFISSGPKNDFVILRHDVEYKISKSISIAEIEADKGISATYYVHGPQRSVCDISVLKEMQEMGHEIGYHYETLDLCAGDHTKAMSMFEEQLKYLRDSGLVIDTVCSHGNPRVQKNGWSDNKEIFIKDDNALIRNNLIGEAYLSIDLDQLEYLSDVGIRWKAAKNTRFLSRRIGRGHLTRIYILTHPDYWSKTAMEALAWRYAAKTLRATKLNKVIAKLRR